MKTQIDIEKAIADFRLTGISGNNYEIRFKNGEFRAVKRKELEQLKIKYPNWKTDF